jgi:dephospho-CoA kinase
VARQHWIAITGGIGEGKSTILAALKGQGHMVASSDAVAHELFDDPAVQAHLFEALGGRGQVTKDVLREAIATEPATRRAVNRIFFPRVLKRLEELSPTFVEIPLLVEACLQGAFSRVWVATCGRDEQIRRLTERYKDQALVSRLIGTQLASSVKLPFADVIVRTNESVDAVNAFVIQAAERELASHVASI